MKNDGMFKELVENSDDIIIVTDEAHAIRYVSSSVRSLFGLEPVALLGRNIFDYIHTDRHERWRQDMGGHTPFRAEEAFQLKHGPTVYFDVHVSRLLSQYPIQGRVLKLHNVTDKKHREHELVRSNQQLDQIIFKTTHDLKAPLMSAMGLVALAEKAPPAEQPKYLELIRKSLSNLDSLIEEMNDFFRNDKMAVQREKIDIAKVLRDETDNLKNLSDEKGIFIAYEVHGAVDFYSDSVRVKTIIGNILSNAVKYYDPQKKRPFVNISITINKDICVLKMADNGIGIEARYQSKIFDLFFRATDRTQGTGLGLFIVKDTIEKLKGSIEVDSAVGLGTTFTISIPNQLYQPVEAE